MSVRGFTTGDASHGDGEPDRKRDGERGKERDREAGRGKVGTASPIIDKEFALTVGEDP